MSQWLGYSTQGVVIVDIVIVSIEIGVVVEVVQPRRPPNVVALNAIISSPLQERLESILLRLCYQFGTSLNQMFHN